MITPKEFTEKTGIEVPNPYIHDHDDHRFPAVNVVWLLITPTGRRSDADLAWAVIKKKGKHANATFTGALEAAIELRGPRQYPLPKTRRGYRWSEPILLHNFWREENA